MTTDKQELRVFLGGTYNGSTWRDEITVLLKQRLLGYFNPTVDVWTERAKLEEIEQRKTCDFCLYTITPEMAGFYSIAEVVDDSNKRPDKTILCILKSANGKEFNDCEYRSLLAVADMVEANGGRVFGDLQKVAEYLQVKRLELRSLNTLSLESAATVVSHTVNVPFKGPDGRPTQIGFVFSERCNKG